MNRLEEALRPGRALIPYLTASDPSPAGFLEAAVGAVEGGASALEIGIPHSDPVADGPVIQRAHERALGSGGGVQATLDQLRTLRKETQAPVVLFTYANPVLAFGAERFLREAVSAGADGILALDVPPEEEPGWYELCRSAGLDPVVLFSPNTSEERAGRFLRAGSGFVYIVARAGVTGTHDGARSDLKRRVGLARALSGLPAAVGFGVKTHEDAAALWRVAEGVVVGSALIAALEGLEGPARGKAARAFVQNLIAPDESIGASDGRMS
jgi:tryptophan synthase alpha chain